MDDVPRNAYSVSLYCQNEFWGPIWNFKFSNTCFVMLISILLLVAHNFKLLQIVTV